jgi:hypothetical protein
VTNVLLVVAAVLSAIAGAAGLAGLNKVSVGVLTLVSAAITAAVISALTFLKFDEHLRAAGEYDALYLRTLACDESARMGDPLFDQLWKAYGDTAARVDASGARLTDRQIDKYEPMARRKLPEIPAEVKRLPAPATET